MEYIIEKILSYNYDSPEDTQIFRSSLDQSAKKCILTENFSVFEPVLRSR